MLSTKPLILYDYTLAQVRNRSVRGFVKAKGACFNWISISSEFQN